VHGKYRTIPWGFAVMRGVYLHPASRSHDEVENWEQSRYRGGGCVTMTRIMWIRPKQVQRFVRSSTRAKKSSCEKKYNVVRRETLRVRAFRSQYDEQVKQYLIVVKQKTISTSSRFAFRRSGLDDKHVWAVIGRHTRVSYVPSSNSP